MAYHLLEGKDIAWLSDVASGANEKGGDRIIMKLQTVDWETGRKLTDSEIGKAVNLVEQTGISNIAFFPAWISGQASDEPKGIIIFNMDDVQENWLEDIAINLTETHIAYGIDVVLGVIPYGLDSMGVQASQWLEEHGDVVEIAQHGYDHNTNYVGLPYQEQYEKIWAGQELLLKFGIEPFTYIPPYSKYDGTTVQVITNMEYHTFLEAADVHFPNPDLDIEKTVRLCRDDYAGFQCELKDKSEIINEINGQIAENGAVFVTYHMQDFGTEEGILDMNKYGKFVDLLETLKGNYVFMTAEEYHQARLSS
jgi:hypothetical protein